MPRLLLNILPYHTSLGKPKSPTFCLLDFEFDVGACTPSREQGNIHLDQ